MSDNANFIHSLYAAFSRGDIATVLAGLAPEVEWVCEGPASLPFFGTFRGPERVAKFFEALATTQSAQTLRIEETYAAGDQVISIGRYSCIVNGTGKTIDSAVAHIFTVKNGQVVRLLDFIDTALAVEAYTPVMAGAGGLTFQARADICWSA